MERWTFDSQRTDKPVNNRPDNLYEPVRRTAVSEGQTGKVIRAKAACIHAAALHPRATVAIVAAVAVGLGVIAAVRRTYPILQMSRRFR